MNNKDIGSALRPTLMCMQSLNDGFHELADALLRHAHVDLRSLKPNGINKEGKPIGGVPDSYVGASPSDCRIGVEYTTTQTQGLSAKFVKDYEGVVERCPRVKKVVLCTNRPESRGIADEVLAKAKTRRTRVQIVWGEELARVLDEQRQDLRKKHLNIPIDTLTRDSLQPALAARVVQATEAYLGAKECVALEHRIRRLPVESQFERLRPGTRRGVTLLVGAAGLGKTSWSASTALRLSRSMPVLWIPARSLGSQSVNAALVMACYGSEQAEKIHELSQQLRQCGRQLVAFIDAIDEHPDYQHIQQALKDFQATSPLASVTHLVLTCRDEALPAFERVEPNSLPSSTSGDAARYLRLGSLPEEQSRRLLKRLGANEREVARVKAELPSELFGNPLYLGLAKQFLLGAASHVDTLWIERFAEGFEREITARFRTPRPLERQRISEPLEKLALATLLTPEGLEVATVLSAISSFGASMRDEFLEHALQSGLLVRSHIRIRFCHALFVEFFAARSLAKQRSLSDEKLVGRIGELPGRTSIARFAARLNTDLLLVFANHAPQLMPDFEVSALTPEVVAPLAERAIQLLDSKYPSERWAGVGILGTLGAASAGSLAVNWFNELSPEKKHARVWEASELFLKLQMPGAAAIASLHRQFRMAPDFPWYDEGFSSELAQMDRRFRVALTTIARRGLSEGSSRDTEEARFVAILTYLEDDYLLERLQEKAMVGPLAEYEHRALMMINTDAAMDVYLLSRGHYFQALSEVQGAVDKSGSQRAALWHRLVPRQADICRFPHDALVRLAARELRASGDREVAFGLELAELLQHPDLVDGYADAVQTRQLFARDMVANLVAGFAPGEVRDLYDGCASVHAKRAILRGAGEIPGAEIEDLLLRALERDELFDDACLGLASQRSVRGAEVLHPCLKRLSGRAANFACKAIARAGYEPALEDLIELFRKAQAASGADTWLSTYDLLGFIGQIGGRAAYDLLAESFDSQRDHRTLAFLLDSHDEYALTKVHEILLQYPEAKRMIGTALQRREHLREDKVYFDDGPTPFEFGDEVLLTALLESASEHLLKAEESDLIELNFRNDYTAVALFDSPMAEEFLRTIALRDPLQANGQVARAIGFARKTLGERGDGTMASHCIRDSLSALADRQQISARELSALQRWPRELVRKALLAALNSHQEQRSFWLLLLSYFASQRDLELFSKHLEDLPPDVADKVRQNLPASCFGGHLKAPNGVERGST